MFKFEEKIRVNSLLIANFRWNPAKKIGWFFVFGGGGRFLTKCIKFFLHFFFQLSGIRELAELRIVFYGSLRRRGGGGIDNSESVFSLCGHVWATTTTTAMGRRRYAV